ncbi:MAG: HEAT repeat domain-containing protein [Opitutae bacterium]|nr:HEAT repeat domain-containing protein [Opitutae bacterium]
MIPPTKFSFRPTALLAAALVCAPAALAAGPDDGWERGATNPVPAHAVATVATDRDAFFIGENVLLHFTLENAGPEPFVASFGGDSRGARRHLRFKVAAVHEDGSVAEDPFPFSMCFGGLGGPLTLAPGSNYACSLPLLSYCQIDTPGDYSIRVSHDYGWKNGAPPRPVAETRISFRLPTAAQAEQVLARMAALSEDPNATWGRRTQDYADFSCLRHPVYLESLLRRVQAGDRRMLNGLELIPAPEATEALLRLAADPDPDLAFAAALSLAKRLPIPADDPFIPTRGPLDWLASRRRLAERSWTPGFAPDARAAALRFLDRTNAPAVALGARLICAVGAANDAPALLAALDRAVESAYNPRREPKDNVLDFPAPIPDLVRAIDLLRARGYVPGDPPQNKGQALLYFLAQAKVPPPRPDGWLRWLDIHAESGKFPLREAALRSIPAPVPPEALPFIRRGLDDADLGVVRAACTLAGQSGNPEFLRPLLDVVAAEQHEWLLRDASEAAQRLGAGFDLLEIWTDRLGDERLYLLALDSLQTALDVPAGNHSGRTDLSRAERLALRTAWKEFLARHADDLRAGRRFKVDDPAVSPALAGRARRWNFPDGSAWPPDPETD